MVSIKDLRQQLRENGLDSKGSKQQLMKRLADFKAVTRQVSGASAKLTYNFTVRHTSLHVTRKFSGSRWIRIVRELDTEVSWYLLLDQNAVNDGELDVVQSRYS